MEGKRTQLFPGVWLRTVHTDKFKSAYLSLTLMTQLDRENASANALLPRVLRRGTMVHPDMESLSAALDELYGGAVEPVVRKKGESQCVGFLASFLDNAYALNGEDILSGAAELLGEMLLNPLTRDGVFDPDYVEGEKANLIDELRGQINDKRIYATRRLTQLMCREESFGADKLGQEDKMAAITPESLWARYQKLLSSAQIEVYYSGSADPERVREIMERVFSTLPVSEEREEPECEVRIHAEQEPNVIEEVMDVNQGKLAMGWRTGGITVWEEECPALVLCSAVFGGTSMSKLFMNVRERLSLCYYASSALEKQKGLMIVSSGIEFQNYETAKREILAQLEDVKAGKITDDELEGARRILINQYRSIEDEQGRMEEYWLGQAAAGTEDDPGTLAARLETVTGEQIAQVARKLELDTVYFLKGKEC
mgnify:FL=1